MRAAWKAEALIHSLVSSVIFSIEASNNSYSPASYKTLPLLQKVKGLRFSSN